MSFQSSEPLLAVVCREENDLFQTLLANRVSCRCYRAADEALAGSREGGAILLLADGYPHEPLPVSPAWLSCAAQKKVRVYLEFPASLPDDGPLAVQKTNRLARGVVASQHLGLPYGSIFALPGAHIVTASSPDPILVSGTVAGFRQIAFGLETAKTAPLLFFLPSNPEVLVATAGLSHFRKGRFAPTTVWQSIFAFILRWLTRGEIEISLGWEPVVRPSYGKLESLPASARDSSISRAAEWFYRARLLPPEGSEAAYRAEKGDSRAAIADWSEGTGKEGLLEGFVSAMDHEGTQHIRWWRRADCVGEVSGALAVAAVAGEKPKWRETASNLADWLYSHSILSQGERANPAHPAYGLLGWHDRTAYGIYYDGWGVFYGDDNARAVLGTIASAGALGIDRWDRSIFRCVLANFRTSGADGFRENRIEIGSLAENGWPAYFTASPRAFTPHFQAYLWACYLWAYERTKYEPFLERSVRGIRLMMEAYPEQWHWTNGIQQERARMLLPLAWLVRVQDRQEYREWLGRIAGELLAHQDLSGAIREEVGASKGKYGPPGSHEAYGKSEAPLLQKNGDPVADLLYTINFAFLGMHEAAAATGEARYVASASQLEEFLLKIQGHSLRPDLDGVWFRAFDFEQWDFWGSDSDGDWGAWCVETGWTQGWITLVLSMRKLGTSLWELGEKRLRSYDWQSDLEEMLSSEAVSPSGVDLEIF